MTAEAARGRLKSQTTVQIGRFTLTLRDLASGDSTAMLDLHNEVFGPNVDERWHAWKYGASPGEGQGQGTGAWHEGRLVAFCGGLPRKFWRHHECLSGMQIGDVMVHPSWRSIFTRRGPFFQVSNHFYDSRLGAQPGRPFQLGFGFPSERHLKLATMTGLLHDGGVIESLHWPTSDATDPEFLLGWVWRTLSPDDERFDFVVSEAWKSMLETARDHDLTLGQRDAAYLRWRYVDRPDDSNSGAEKKFCYRFVELCRPWSFAPVGVAVLNLSSPSAHWLDWIGPVEFLGPACQACRIEAARAGAAELTAWASAAVVDQLAQSGFGLRVVCAGLGIPVASDLKPEEVPQLRLWLMGGDTDFL